MPIIQIGSPEARYLAATDILLGDMSDTNYEFLLFNRPIILLANDWLRANFPDIGIKTDLRGLEDAIHRSLEDPYEFEPARREWLSRTIHEPYGKVSKQIIEMVIQKAGYQEPTIVLVHGDSEVRRTNLQPMFEAAGTLNIPALFVSSPLRAKRVKAPIILAAHFRDLSVPFGYKVHLDHGLKGLGTANLEMSKRDYAANNFFPHIDLHITAGEVGDKRTKWLLESNGDRTIIAGYPKADHLNRYNTAENKVAVLKELGFSEDRPLITYAPAGEHSYEKPGGSLSPDVIGRLNIISEKTGLNILIKLKQQKVNFTLRVLRKFARYMPFRDFQSHRRTCR